MFLAFGDLYIQITYRNTTIVVNNWSTIKELSTRRNERKTTTRGVTKISKGKQHANM